MTGWVSFSKVAKDGEKLSQRRKMINLINQLLIVVTDGREEICKQGSEVKMYCINWLCIPQAVSSAALPAGNQPVQLA